MKRLSLQWRITLMTVLLIGVTCVAMNLLLCSSGVYYMDTIADTLQGGDTVIMNSEGAESFNPQLVTPDEDLTIVVNGAQGRFRMTNWYITAAVTLLSGVLAYFVSGRALKPLRSFVSQVEKVQLNNLADMRINENVLPEFRQLSCSFNQMLERLDNAFAAQRQFTGNAAHELRTPLALMQAQLELFSAEHPDMLPETAKFLALLREQTERLTQMTKTLLEMSNLQQVARNEQIQLAPMVEEVFTDLALLAEKRNITLEMEGDGFLIGSDALIYRLLFNLTENAVKYNRSGGSVASVAVACHEAGHAAQRQSGYAMMKVRTALVPVVNFTQNTWTIVLLMGLFMNIAGLTTLALIFFSFSVLFQLVTLPVEIDASRRAVAYIEQSGMSSQQVNGAKKVLTAAALTYVAAALTSIIQLLYLMARYNRNSNR